MVDMEGERILIPERMIVSPADGIYRSATENGELLGEEVNIDDVIGYVETVGQSIPVTSPFCGTIHGLIAHTGERLRRHEPVAWLRVVND
ncbi:MAG: hypothetical protein U0R17_00070 [Acidimicrobiia bacterium]